MVKVVKVKMVKMEIEIENTQACFVQLWLRLERTRQQFRREYKYYCIRRVLQTWFGAEATDDFIWRVCTLASHDEEIVCGYDLLPKPSLYPRVHRYFLHALVQVKLGLNSHQVLLGTVDQAYSIAFPLSTPINVEKKKRKKEDYVR